MLGEFYKLRINILSDLAGSRLVPARLKRQAICVQILKRNGAINEFFK